MFVNSCKQRGKITKKTSDKEQKSKKIAKIPIICRIFAS